MGYFSAFWSSSRWPRCSRRQKLLARVNWYLRSSLNTLLNKSQVINFIIEVVVTDRFHCNEVFLYKLELSYQNMNKFNFNIWYALHYLFHLIPYKHYYISKIRQVCKILFTNLAYIYNDNQSIFFIRFTLRIHKTIKYKISCNQNLRCNKGFTKLPLKTHILINLYVWEFWGQLRL